MAEERRDPMNVLSLIHSRRHEFDRMMARANEGASWRAGKKLSETQRKKLEKLMRRKK